MKPVQQFIAKIQSGPIHSTRQNHTSITRLLLSQRNNHQSSNFKTFCTPAIKNKPSKSPATSSSTSPFHCHKRNFAKGTKVTTTTVQQAATGNNKPFKYSGASQQTQSQSPSHTPQSTSKPPLPPIPDPKITDPTPTIPNAIGAADASIDGIVLPTTTIGISPSLGVSPSLPTHPKSSIFSTSLSTVLKISLGLILTPPLITLASLPFIYYNAKEVEGELRDNNGIGGYLRGVRMNDLLNQYTSLSQKSAIPGLNFNTNPNDIDNIAYGLTLDGRIGGGRFGLVQNIDQGQLFLLNQIIAKEAIATNISHTIINITHLLAKFEEQSQSWEGLKSLGLGRDDEQDEVLNDRKDQKKQNGQNTSTNDPNPTHQRNNEIPLHLRALISISIEHEMKQATESLKQLNFITGLLTWVFLRMPLYQKPAPSLDLNQTSPKPTDLLNEKSTDLSSNNNLSPSDSFKLQPSATNIALELQELNGSTHGDSTPPLTSSTRSASSSSPTPSTTPPTQTPSNKPRTALPTLPSTSILLSSQAINPMSERREIGIGNIITTASPLSFIPVSLTITPFILSITRYSTLVYNLMNHLTTLNNIQLYLSSMNSNNWRDLSDKDLCDFFNLLKLTDFTYIPSTNDIKHTQKSKISNDTNNNSVIYNESSHINKLTNDNINIPPPPSLQIDNILTDADNVRSPSEIDSFNHSFGVVGLLKGSRCEFIADDTPVISISPDYYSQFDHLYSLLIEPRIQSMLFNLEANFTEDGSGVESVKGENKVVQKALKNLTISLEPFLLDKAFYQTISTPDVIDMIDIDVFKIGVYQYEKYQWEQYNQLHKQNQQKIINERRKTEINTTQDGKNNEPNLLQKKTFKPPNRPKLTSVLSSDTSEFKIQNEDGLKSISTRLNAVKSGNHRMTGRKNQNDKNDPNNSKNIINSAQNDDSIDSNNLKITHPLYPHAPVPDENNYVHPVPNVSSNYYNAKVLLAKLFQEALSLRLSSAPKSQFTLSNQCFPSENSGIDNNREEQAKMPESLVIPPNENNQLLSPFFFFNDYGGFFTTTRQSHGVVPLPRIMLHEFVDNERKKYYEMLRGNGLGDRIVRKSIHLHNQDTPINTDPNYNKLDTIIDINNTNRLNTPNGTRARSVDLKKIKIPPKINFVHRDGKHHDDEKF